jgi:hypothetical protein
VTTRAIAETIGAHLKVPVVSVKSGDEATAQFGGLAGFMSVVWWCGAIDICVRV